MDVEKEVFMEAAELAEKENRRGIYIFQDKDGNWMGGITKEGKEIFVRDIGPETVLQKLLTHDGK